jgi:Cu/Ag efflux protein CusF
MIRLPNWLVALLALVVLLGLTNAVVAKEAKGTIDKVSADKKELIVKDADGKTLTFQMDEDAKIELNDKESKLNDLKKGDEVTVTFEEKGGKLIASKVQCKR